MYRLRAAQKTNASTLSSLIIIIIWVSLLSLAVCVIAPSLLTHKLIGHPNLLKRFFSSSVFNVVTGAHDDVLDNARVSHILFNSQKDSDLTLIELKK